MPTEVLLEDKYAVTVLSALTNPATASVVAIAAGADHDVVLRGDGTIAVWGWTNNVPWNINPPGLSNVQAVAAGYYTTAVVSNGIVLEWGANFLLPGLTNVPPGLSNVVQIAAGEYHTLALTSAGGVVAWGYTNDFYHGECNVPAAASNDVVAISAGGYHSLALRADGTVVMWGDFTSLPRFMNLTNAVAIAAGQDTFAFAICQGDLAPMIAIEPVNQYPPTNGTATFTAYAYGDNVQYQWQFYGTNLAGATTATLTLANVAPAQAGPYRVVVTDASGSQTSSNATLALDTPPGITAVGPPTPSTNYLVQGQSLALSVTAGPNYPTNPLGYEWQLNGTNLVNGTGSNYFVPRAMSAEGSYSLIVTNSLGTTNVGPWWVRAALPGMVAVWGDDSLGACDRPGSLTNAAAIAVGGQHCVVARDDGSVLAWGANNWAQTNVPAGLSGVIAVAAGTNHSLALTSGGAVAAWGDNSYGQTTVPSAALSNVIAISAAGNQSLALGSNGLVIAWGQTNGPVPAGLSNVTAIAAGDTLALALTSGGTVVAWGQNGNGQTNVPAGLSNVVAIAAGRSHALALGSNGRVTAWGANGSRQATVPGGLTNVIGVAAGTAHSLARLNDGTTVAWGDNRYGQTNASVSGAVVKLIAAVHYLL